MSDIITRDNPRIVAFFKALDRMAESLDRLAENSKPLLGGESYVTDKDVSARLKVRVCLKILFTTISTSVI